MGPPPILAVSCTARAFSCSALVSDPTTLYFQLILHIGNLHFAEGGRVETMCCSRRGPVVQGSPLRRARARGRPRDLAVLKFCDVRLIACGVRLDLIC